MLLESKQMKFDWYKKNSTSMVCDWVKNVYKSIETKNNRPLKKHKSEVMFAPSDRKLNFAKKAERRLFQINKALRDHKNLLQHEESFEEIQVFLGHKDIAQRKENVKK